MYIDRLCTLFFINIYIYIYMYILIGPDDPWGGPKTGQKQASKKGRKNNANKEIKDFDFTINSP